MLTKNIGGIDRMLRTGAGLAMIYLGSINTQLVTDEFARAGIVVIGGISILIAFIAFCPLYRFIDFTTVSEKKSLY